MERSLLITVDGSHTIQELPGGETFHSIYGAVQESRQVFIREGLAYASRGDRKQLAMFEMGFGSGLNALLSLIYARENGLHIHYEAIEPYPLPEPVYTALNYCEHMGRQDLQEDFLSLHRSDHDRPITPDERFHFVKRRTALEKYIPDRRFDLIYFDAFAPSAQPELWTEAQFAKIFDYTAPGGVLVTYCSKVIVQRALRACGFIVEKRPGPPGKLEILRATKP